MSDTTTSELLMKFQRGSGGAVEAECPLTLSPNDKLARLAAMAPAFEAGRFFLISEFSFGAALSDSESPNQQGATTASGKQQNVASSLRGGRPVMQGGVQPGQLGPGGRLKTTTGANAGSNTGTTSASGQFSRWRSATDDSWKKDGAYPAQIQQFSATRKIDRATPVLFDYCCRKENFVSASVIKRKAACAADGASFEALSYLRMDFTTVLISGLNWNDGDVVEETVTFTAQAMRIIYWQQRPNGTLAALNAVDWTSPAATQAAS
jgi:type VI protein secretion system component Hcp